MCASAQPNGSQLHTMHGEQAWHRASVTDSTDTHTKEIYDTD